MSCHGVVYYDEELCGISSFVSEEKSGKSSRRGLVRLSSRGWIGGYGMAWYVMESSSK